FESQRDGQMKKILKFCIGFFLAVTALCGVLSIRGDWPQARAFLQQWPIIQQVVAQREEDLHRAKLTQLNHILPNFQTLITHLDAPKGSSVHQDKVGSQYEQYYAHIIATFPQMSEAYAFLGYVHYANQKFDEARLDFEKGAGLNPLFFWHHYNLGVLSLKDEAYPQALKHFQNALRTNPQLTLKIMLSSKAYQQIFAQLKTPPDIQHRLEAAYARCYLFMGEILTKLGYADQGRELVQKAESANVSKANSPPKPQLF
ncbi:MAG: hypothetical protein KC713_08440, partial [Candidatus Omnitrophica bacterium]|nr:hypothetical protein [Candidatus Omnitrophota bacterium]